MRILIITNGDAGDINLLKTFTPPYDYLICADGGIQLARCLGLTPDLIVGDFDSVPHDILDEYKKKHVSMQQFPIEKDKTDTQIAVDIAIDMKAAYVFLLGALGHRWDHSYANVMLLMRLAKHGIKAQIIDSHNRISISNDTIQLYGNPGDIISILPFGGDGLIKKTEGLQYHIENKMLPMDFPYGISNVLTQTHSKIVIGSGWIITVQTRD